jgi:ATP-dependent exoDNAse (exonuclease V) beta subunit
VAARDTLLVALDAFQERADADLAALLHGELQECLRRYAAAKERDGALDYQDLLLRARDLVRDDGVVRRHFQQRFTRIFVDEFQDTDPVQAEFLLLLAAGDPDVTRWRDVVPVPGKLFIVGDPKQSIYRFRGADVDVYRQVCDQLVAAGARVLELRRSFRGVPGIQRLVNAAFGPVMDGDLQARQAHHVPLEAYRPDNPTQPAVVVLPVPKPYGPRGVSAREIERSLPDAVGAYVDWLVRHSGWTVTERRDPDRPVPIEARHICILFRRFVSFGDDVTRPYVEALEARGLRHLLVGGKSFHDREEIETLRAALTAIEWPDDELSVFATLRGALFAVGDEELLEYHRLAGGFRPFQRLAEMPSGLEAVRDALEVLRSLHARRNTRPVADTVAELLTVTRAHVGFVLRPAGEQALANVLHVGELARQYEREGGMSFRGFVERLRDEAGGGQAAEAPILEEGSDGVRLMTVHKAKGLEFPVVVLADITCKLTPNEVSRHVDLANERCAIRLGGYYGWAPKDLNDQRGVELRREQAEGARVAYVAATRARDLLVVPAVGDEPYDEGWLAPLNPAIYPEESRRRVADAGPGCPLFKSRDSVLERPGNDPASSRTVSPGRHAHGDGAAAYETVWWSPEPERLVLGVQPSFGLRRDDLIVKGVAPAVLRDGLEAHASWRQRRDAAVEAGRLPSVVVTTATEFAAAAALAAVTPGADWPSAHRSRADVRVETLPGPGSRPAGARFGSLVHVLLAEVPLDESGEQVLPGLAAGHARLLGADRAEVEAAVDLVRRAVRHDILRAAARAHAIGRCHREAPVTHTVDGRLIEGIVDLAFETEAGFVVVDFKTDRAQGELLEQHRQQVGFYADAIATATGRPAQAVLLQV